MRKQVTILMSVIALIAIVGVTLLIGCSPRPVSETPGASVPELETPRPTPPTGESGSTSFLTPNPVETAMPQYGGIIRFGQQLPMNFDGHQKVAYGPVVTLPTFNQLVMFSLDYKETVPENIVGDLAESWETSADGLEITFKLQRGVRWHDGQPFTAGDVVYSLEKMTDPNRSAIATSFPAYQSAEKLDDYTVKVRLKYPSAGFMMALASGDAVIQATHLAGTDPQSPDFMVGTGPFIVDDFKIRVHLKWERNPNYWKKDKYGNQLPYLDGIQFFQTGNVGSNEMLIARRLDLKNPVTGAGTLNTYQFLKDGAPDLLWQRRDRPDGDVIFLNLDHPPLNDVRVRRAMAMVVDEESLIIGSSDDAIFGVTDIGILPPGVGLPSEEILELLGWDKPLDERAAEARQLLAEAGYPNGFKITMIATGATSSSGGVNLVYADLLRRYLNIEADVLALGTSEKNQRLRDGSYDLHTDIIYIGENLVKLADYFGTNGSGNSAHYSNTELDSMLAELDHIIDPEERREALWDIERLLLTDLPALPTGTFTANLMPYYNWVKNIRWTYTSYSNVCRFEDVWIDQSIAKQAGLETTPTTTPTTPPPAETPTTPAPSDNETPPAATTPPAPTTPESYDRPDIPIIWESIDPPEALAGTGTTVTIVIQAPPGSLVTVLYILPVSGTRSTSSLDSKVAGADGKVTLSFAIHPHVNAGEGTLELTLKKADGTEIVITRPYLNK
jgi:peptide/nickel transport system substrate-binding protein